jgi:hypothetical protein
MLLLKPGCMSRLVIRAQAKARNAPIRRNEPRGIRALTLRTRKLIGAIALVAFLAVYALGAMMTAIVLQVNGSKTVELVYYIVAGLLWVLPAGWLIRWMQRP